jgi:hypothetical protein
MNPAPTDLNSLIREYPIQCRGYQNDQWLIKFRRALHVCTQGLEIRRGYMGDDALANWLTYQRRNKSLLERVKQDLLGWIGL